MDFYFLALFSLISPLLFLETVIPGLPRVIGPAAAEWSVYWVPGGSPEQK